MYVPETPFDGIEGAQEYVRLLGDALDEARGTIREDLDAAGSAPVADRRVQALRIVEYKLTQLQGHIAATGRLLNDLRTLRRLLLGERGDTPAESGKEA